MDRDYRPFTIDFESTDKDASIAHPIEVGVFDANDGEFELESLIALPEGVTIPPETSAVHHIIDEDLLGAPSWPEVLVNLRRQLSLNDSLKGLVLIAHNAEYEQGILSNTCFCDLRFGESVEWICTWKVALRLWPEAPSHSNEGLRYWLGFGRRGRAFAQASHSALHDARVTAGIFHAACHKMMTQFGLDRDEAICQMIAWSMEMPQLPTCPIGKERGKKWSEIDAGFLQWCLRQPDMRSDVQHACREELERRRRANR